MADFDEEMFAEAVADLGKGILQTQFRDEPGLDPNVDFVNVRVSMLLGQTRVYPKNYVGELPPEWIDVSAEEIVTAFADKCVEIGDALNARIGRPTTEVPNDLRRKLRTVADWFHMELGYIPTELQGAFTENPNFTLHREGNNAY